MLKINVPFTPWSEQSITLNGVEYRFIFSFNERSERWHLSIYLRDVPIKTGLVLMENGLLLGNYRLDDFDHGKLFCVRMKKSGKNAGYDNTGFGKAYELIYLTNEELNELEV